MAAQQLGNDPRYLLPMREASFNFLENEPRGDNSFFLLVFRLKITAAENNARQIRNRGELLLLCWTQYYRGSRRGLRYRVAIMSDK